MPVSRVDQAASTFEWTTLEQLGGGEARQAETGGREGLVETVWADATDHSAETFARTWGHEDQVLDGRIMMAHLEGASRLARGADDPATMLAPRSFSDADVREFAGLVTEMDLDQRTAALAQDYARDPAGLAAMLAQLATSDPHAYRLCMNALAPTIQNASLGTLPRDRAFLDEVTRLGDSRGAAQVKQDLSRLVGSNLFEAKRRGDDAATAELQRMNQQLDRAIAEPHTGLIVGAYRREPARLVEYLLQHPGTREADLALVAEQFEGGLDLQDRRFLNCLERASGPGRDRLAADVAIVLGGKAKSVPNAAGARTEMVREVGLLLSDPAVLDRMLVENPRKLRSRLAQVMAVDPDLAARIIGTAATRYGAEIGRAAEAGDHERADVNAYRLGQLVGMAEWALSNSLPDPAKGFQVVDGLFDAIGVAAGALGPQAAVLVRVATVAKNQWKAHAEGAAKQDRAHLVRSFSAAMRDFAQRALMDVIDPDRSVRSGPDSPRRSEHAALVARFGRSFSDGFESGRGDLPPVSYE